MMHEGGADAADLEPVASAASKKFRILATKEQSISIDETDLLKHFAPNRKAHAVEPADAYRVLHSLQKGLREIIEVVIKFKFHHRWADHIQVVFLSGRNLRLDKIVGADDVVVQQHNPITGRQQGALSPGAAASQVDRIDHGPNVTASRQPIGRVVSTAVINDQQ